MKKNRMIKSGVIGLLFIALLVTPLFGEENATIDLENFKETILLTSYDIQKAEIEVELEEYDYDEALDNQGKTGSTTLETLQYREYNIDEAKIELDYAKWELKEMQESTIRSGVETYFTYLQTLEELENQKAVVERNTKELEQVKSKVDLGLAVASDITSAEITLTKAELAKSELEYELQSQMYTLNDYLLWDLDKVSDVFDMEVPEVELEEYDLEVLSKTVISIDGEIIQAQAEIELAKDYLDLLDIAGTNVNSDDYKDAEDDLEDKELDLENLIRSKELEVYSAHNSLLKYNDTVRLKELELENKEIEHEVLVKRQAVGLETQNTIDSSKESLDSAELAVEQAKLDLYIQYMVFEDLLK